MRTRITIAKQALIQLKKADSWINAALTEADEANEYPAELAQQYVETRDALREFLLETIQVRS